MGNCIISRLDTPQLETRTIDCNHSIVNSDGYISTYKWGHLVCVLYGFVFLISPTLDNNIIATNLYKPEVGSDGFLWTTISDINGNGKTYRAGVNSDGNFMWFHGLSIPQNTSTSGSFCYLTRE